MLSNFFKSSSLNVLLLGRVLSDQGVAEDVIDAVSRDLIEEVALQSLNGGVLTAVFEKHHIEDIAEHTFNELMKDPVCTPYGTIACP